MVDLHTWQRLFEMHDSASHVLSYVKVSHSLDSESAFGLVFRTGGAKNSNAADQSKNACRSSESCRGHGFTRAQ